MDIGVKKHGYIMGWELSYKANSSFSTVGNPQKMYKIEKSRNSPIIIFVGMWRNSSVLTVEYGIG